MGRKRFESARKMRTIEFKKTNAVNQGADYYVSLRHFSAVNAVPDFVFE